MSSYQYGDLHVKDKTVSKRQSLYGWGPGAKDKPWQIYEYSKISVTWHQANICFIGIIYSNADLELRLMELRADSWFAPSQWEMALLCNEVSHSLGTSLESVLELYPMQTV